MNRRAIVLASASPRRARLLKKIFGHFTIRASGVDESGIRAVSPEEYALKAALAKASAVAARSRNALVIGADTIVVLGKKVLGKPKDKKEAVAMLKRLSGKTHRVITGLAVIDSKTKKIAAGFEETGVKMKKIKTGELLDYVESGAPLDKAGGYGIQEIESLFIDRIEGDYDNVVGLPVIRLKRLLRAFPAR
jgi:septum formation protein